MCNMNRINRSFAYRIDHSMHSSPSFCLVHDSHDLFAPLQNERFVDSVILALYFFCKKDQCLRERKNSEIIFLWCNIVRDFQSLLRSYFFNKHSTEVK